MTAAAVDEWTDRMRVSFLLADEARGLGLVVTRLQPGPVEGTYVVQMWTPVGALLAHDETLTGARVLELFRIRAREMAAERAAAELAAAPRVAAVPPVLVRRPAGPAGAGFDAWLQINGVDPGDVDVDAGVLADHGRSVIEYESVGGRRRQASMRLTPPVSLLEQGPMVAGGVR